MTSLARRLTLWPLVLYGIGDVLGAGIYALVGKVALVSGRGAWISFLVSALLAAITGLTYAELSSRIPKSAGAAAYAAEAFRHRAVPFLVGWLVLASGMTSAATVSLALQGYLDVFFQAPSWASSGLFLAFVSFLAFWGIRESAAANNIMTLVEITGLFLVIGVGLSWAARENPGELVARLSPDQGAGPVLSGAALAFFAFIGFEDLANLAEEAKNPSRDIPRAILWAVGLATALYLLVVCVVLWVMTPQEAGQSPRPLLEVLVRAGHPLPPRVFASVALLAICNTGLANFIMASRLLYGMAGQNLLPRPLAQVHPVRQTPWVAVLCVLVLCSFLAFTGGAALLAQTTSLLLLLVFAVLHVSLILLRRRGPAGPGLFKAPTFVPYVGLGVCLALATRMEAGAYPRAAAVLGAGALFSLIFLSPKSTAGHRPA